MVCVRRKAGLRRPSPNRRERRSQRKACVKGDARSLLRAIMIDLAKADAVPYGAETLAVRLHPHENVSSDEAVRHL